MTDETLETAKGASLAAYKKAASKLDNLSPSARKMADSLIGAGLVSEDAIVSGYRSPQRNAAVGGARKSRHTRGDAIDISTKDMTDEQRQKLLQAAIANGARGVGIYPGGSLHFDTRETPAFWGPGGSYKGTNPEMAPAWARNDVAKLLGMPSTPQRNTAAGVTPAPTPASTAPMPPPNIYRDTLTAPSQAMRPDLYEKPTSFSFYDTAGAAARQMDTYTLFQTGRREAYDPTFTWTPENIERFTKGMNQNERNWLLDNAASEAHAERLRKRIEDDRRDDELLSGWGVTARLGAAFVDPLGWVAGFGAGKAVSLSGTAVSRMGRAAQGGLIGFGANLPLAAVQNAEKPNYGLDDFLLESVAGITLGAGFGAMARHSNPITQQFMQDQARRIERRVYEDNGATITKKGEDEYFGPKAPADAGAARNIARDNEVSAAWKHGRIDAQGSLLHEGNIFVKETAADLMPDAVGVGGRQLADKEAAWEWMQRKFESVEVSVNRPVNDAFQEWAEQRGLGLAGRIKQKDDFLEEVGRGVFDPTSIRDPSVAKAAEEYRKGFRQVLKDAKESGAEWAQKIDEDDFYFPIMFDRDKVRQYVDRFGDDGVISVIRQGFLSANPEYGSYFATRYANRAAVKAGSEAARAEAPAIRAGAREVRDDAIAASRAEYQGDTAVIRDRANEGIATARTEVEDAKAAAGGMKDEARTQAAEARAEAQDLRSRASEAYKAAVEDGEELRASARALRAEAAALSKQGNDAAAMARAETRATRVQKMEAAELRAIDLISEADEFDNLAHHLRSTEAAHYHAEAARLRGQMLRELQRADDLKSGQAVRDDAANAAAPFKSAASATRDEANALLQSFRERIEVERQARNAVHTEANAVLRSKLAEAADAEDAAHALLRSTRIASEEAIEKIKAQRTALLREAADQNKVDRALAKTEARRAVKQNLDEAFSEAFTAAFNRHFDPAKRAFADRAARRYFSTVRNVTEGMQAGLARATAGADREALREILMTNGMSRLEADLIVESTKSASKSGPGHFRRRAPIDDLRSFTPDGFDEKAAFGLRDLTQQNAEEVFQKYARQTMGHSAMARAGFQTKGAWNKHLDEITLGQANSVPGYTDSLAKKHRRILEMYGKRIYGEPLEDMSNPWRKAGTILGNLNFVRFMQWSGLAQLGDAPKVLLYNGTRAAWNSFDLGDIARSFRKGSKGARDELARDLEIGTGLGYKTGRNRVAGNYNELDEFYEETGSAKFMDRAVQLSRTGANITANVSLLNPMTDFLQRWATRATLQNLVDVSRGVKKYDEKLMNDIGVSKQLLDRVRALSDKMELADNGIIRKLNREALTQMDDEGFDQLMAMVTRGAKKQVLETNPGNLPPFLQTQIGRLFMQFKSFMFASYAANTLHNWKMGPAFMAQSLIIGMAWTSLVHFATTYAKSIGRGDQEEFLKERLNPKALLASSFERSADAGILPSIIDTGLMIAERMGAGDDLQLFTNSRTSDLATNFVQGLPSMRTASDLWDTAVNMPADIIRDDRVTTQKEFKSRMSIINPFANAYGVINVTNSLAELFPKKDPNDRPKRKSKDPFQ